MPRRIEKLPMIVQREMRRQQSDRCQRYVTCFEAFEDDRIPPRYASSLDPCVRCVLGQVERLGAVREER
jgi:hypothetical protein